MALLFCDGFDYYATADINRKWSASGNVIISSTGGRRGGGAGGGNSGSSYFQKGIPSVSTVTVGFAYKAVGGLSAGTLICLQAGETTQCNLYMNSSGYLFLYLFYTTTTLIGGQSSQALSTDAWHYLELQVTIGDSGSYEVRLDGVNVMSGTGDTQYITNRSTVNSVRIGRSVESGNGALRSSSGYAYIDDLYITDTSGSVNTGFLGDVRIDTLYPNGAGNSEQFATRYGGGSYNYEALDETTDADDDTTYVEEDTVGNKDTYAFGNLSHTPTSIFGAQINAVAKKTTAGSRGLATVTRSGGTDYDGATEVLPSDYKHVRQIREVDPATSAAWTTSNINAAEFGIKVAS